MSDVVGSGAASLTGAGAVSAFERRWQGTSASCDQQLVL
jgi:hypothetical protein